LDIPCKIPLEEKRPPQLQILNLSSWIYIYIYT
jgi:hypothetical protein